ncbi:MAG: ADP-glucose pyrophosphorylase small subunit [Monoraphidium minutum]|nr:MAG: ADP-glucose pyrophosphorylase small subunit [Monoraphidium minutum]
MQTSLRGRAAAQGASARGSSARRVPARVLARNVSVSRSSKVVVAMASVASQPKGSVAQNGSSQAAADAKDFGNLEMSKTVLGIILGGGAGSRLYPLTKNRAKPAVPLGANYRLIDIPVSNCVNSNVTKIYTLTQFNSASLNRHLSQAYNGTVGSTVGNNKGFVEVLAASQSPMRKEWFQGTADAVRQYLWLFEEAVRDGVEDYLILSGDHLYRMDYREFVRKHRDSGAAITIAALPCDEKNASAFGLMKIDASGRVVEFAEKPKGDALKSMQVDTTVLGVDAETAKAKPYIASMGIYVIKASALKEMLEVGMPEANDFGNEIIPGANKMGFKIQAHAFQGYWEDIGTIEAFYNANLALAKPGKTDFSFYDKNAPIYTMSRFLPPSKVVDAEIHDAIIGDGCVIKSGATIRNSVIGLRTLVQENAVIEDTLILGADYYETKEECTFVPGCQPIGVGRGAIVRKALIDKNVRIGDNVQIINKGGVTEANREDEGFLIKDGIVVVCKNALIKAGTII